MQVDHSAAIIEISDLSYSYTNEAVLKNINLAVHKGDYLGIVGPNGGGKSTLIKAMIGIITPASGKVKLFDKDIKDFNDWPRIGYVPQKTHIEINFPATVEEIVAMGRYGKRGLLRFPKKEDKLKVLDVLDKVDMLEFKDRQISELSGGQQQRVFIARALSSEPEVIFLDEPTVGVDIKTQKSFYALLRKLNHELNLTLVIATHELDVVSHEATELAYINRTIEYYGEPEEFLKGKYFHELIGKEGLHR